MYKHVLFTLLLLFAREICGEELKIFTSGGFQGISDGDGEILIPPVYETLGWSDGNKEIVAGTIGFRESGRWGLINIRNKKASDPEYIVLKPFEGELFEAGIKGRLTNLIFHGLIDRSAKTHLDFRFFSVERIDDHRVLVSEYADNRLRYGMYTDSNERVIPLEYAFIKKEGAIFVALNDQKKKRLFDRNGMLLVTDWIDEIRYSGATLEISSNGKWGLLDSGGRLLHPIKYKAFQEGYPVEFPEWKITKGGGENIRSYFCDSIQGSGDLLIAHVNNVEHILDASEKLFADQHQELRYIGKGFLVTQNSTLDSWGIYKTDGTEIGSGFDSVVVDSSYFYANTAKGWHVYNFFGRRISDHPFQAVDFSQEGILPVKRTDYWGLVDFQGDQLIAYKFDRLLRTPTGTQFLANYLHKWGVTTVNNRWVILPEYDSIYTFNDLYIAIKGLAYSVFDARGALKCKFAYTLSHGSLLKLRDQDKVGVITSSGILLHPIYDEVRLVDGYYELRSGPYVALADPGGRMIVKESDKIQQILAYSEGYFMILKDGKHGFLDENGKLRIANRYDEALPYDEGLAPVKLLGRWGYIDKLENLVIQPFYSSSGRFENELAVIKTADKYGLIDKDGQEVIQPAWKYIERLSTGNYLVTDMRDKVGLANKNGHFLIRPDYDALQDTGEGLIIATRSGKKGVLDYTGLTRLPFEYSDVKITGDYMLLLKAR